MPYTLLLSCVAAGVVWVLATPLRTGLWRFPGPWWRRYTDLFQVLDAYYERTRSSIQQLHAEYGPVVLVGPRTLLFSDPAMVDKVYANRSPLPKSHHFAPMRHEINNVVYPNILSMETTQDHATIKRPIAGIYSMSNVTKSERFIDECILQFVHQLDLDFISKGKTLPVYQWAHFWAYDTVMKLTASADFGLVRGEADREGMFRGMHEAQKFRAMVICMPWTYPFLKRSPMAKLIVKRLGSFPRRARELIQARRMKGVSTTKAHDREDLLDQLLQTKEKFPETVDELVLHGYATTPLFAGGESVASLVTAVIYFVGKHPAVAVKLHEELQSSRLQMPPQWAEVQKMAYLEAVIHETFRCLPLGAALSRRAIPPGRDFILKDGRRVPSGTSVAMFALMTHFNQDVYGPDAHEFRPERWFIEPGESQDEYAERLRWMNKADLTWGQGDRACMGKNIARCEIYKLVATLYSTFDIQLVDPDKEWKLRESLAVRPEGVEATLRFRPGASLDQLRSAKSEKDAPASQPTPMA
ncbi:putative cytochrome P450 monooxygenase [Thozetella sp. PMI_491]|nr:putative cytochrome P450 monooxygenase [Thozetella sp. PMI_491]